MSFKDLAQPLIERGVPVIPLRPRTKAAFSSDWPTLATTDLKQISRWDAEYPTANIGCVGLAQENGIWFFEIDDSTLVKRIEGETGQKFPKTFKVRSRAGRGHIYFKHTPSTIALAFKKAYYSLKNATGGEVCSARLNHAYVVGPGSTHPDTGLQYETISFAPIIDAPEWLVDWIKKNLATDVSITANDDGEEPILQGSRDNVLASLAGRFRQVMKADEEQLFAYLSDVNEKRVQPPLSETDIRRIAHSIGQKPIKTASIQLTSGGKTEAELAQQPAQAAAAGLPVIDDRPAIVDEPYPEFPEMSGALWELAQEMYPDIPMSFKFMSLVTHWGLLRSGLDVIAGQRNFQTRFYVCLVAEPWRGKTAAMNEARNFMSQFEGPNIPLLYAESIDSGPALVDDFEDLRKAHPNAARQMILLHADEMADLFEKAKSTASARNTLAGTWLSLYESNTASNRARNANKGRRIQIETAHFAIVGGTTIDGYEMMWTKTGGGSNGLMSRFIPIGTNAGRMPVNPQESSAKAQIECMLKIKDLIEKPGQTVCIEADAEKALREWWDKYRQIDSPSSTRILDMVKRMLIVLAVTNPVETEDMLGDENVRYVSDKQVQQACAFGDYVVQMRERLNPIDSYTFVQNFENAIMRLFERYPNRPFTQAEMLSRLNVSKKPGGKGSFLQAWKNNMKADQITEVGRTRKGTPVYQKKEAE